MATENSLNSDRPCHYPSKHASMGSQTKADTDKLHRGNTKEPGRSGFKDMLGSVGICSRKTSKIETSVDHVHGEDLEQDAHPGSKDMLGSVGIHSQKTSKVKTSIDHVHGEDLGQDACPDYLVTKAQDHKVPSKFYQ
ncbi:hypothetical protein PILCRDRAFT_9446 [Piloderma croceum F 1598]|uniref:Uncharacterized protein n=1 Tax=Piloderma croceum (strain F 1598) TaxID=765440 RepID=A0A0C3FLR9_PILCF|nr:hypothetical protein PILCRDRAFT_9446 [Piloderma croceum F 1598]